MVATRAKTAMMTRHCFTTPLVEQGRTSLLEEPFDASQGDFVVDGAHVVVDSRLRGLKTHAGLLKLAVVVLEESVEVETGPVGVELKVVVAGTG